MPRFFFIHHDGDGLMGDDLGLELLDLASARTQAIAGARSMMGDSIGRGHLDLTAYIVIENDRRDEVGRVTFRDAVSIRG